MNTKLASDQQQMADLRLSSVLDALDCAAVDAGQLSEPLLGEIEVHPLDAHAVADRPSGVTDPLVVCGLHDSHAPLKIILCPQQVCGIL